MKIVQVGSSGHYAYALPALQKRNADWIGLAMGDQTEECTCEKQLASFGFFPTVYSSFNEMMEQTEADLLIVNSYMGYNADFAVTALNRGISVYCEKPIATTADDLKRVMKAFRDANTPASLHKTGRERVCLCGMFGILDEPCFHLARTVLCEGAIGEIRLVNGQKSYRLGNREPFYSDRRLYGGTIPWVSIHAIDWAWRLSGIRPTEVTARHSRGANNGNGTLESTAFCLFSDDEGRMISVSADYLRPKAAPTHGDDRLRLVGTEGILEIMGGVVTLIDKNGKRELPLPPASDHFEEFLSEIETGKTGFVSARDSFYSTYLALIARDSADENVTKPLSFDAFCADLQGNNRWFS